MEGAVDRACGDRLVGDLPRPGNAMAPGERREVFAPVIGPDGDALRRLPDEFLLVIGALQIRQDRRLPFLGGNGREIRQKPEHLLMA